MALLTDTQLGPYTIVAPLGAGGMGEVYRARDTRLDRDVAIKVLPDSMTRDADRISRFEREAKVLASLNHPNIGAIHGFETAEARKFLVLEYVEGETLAQRLKAGALPVDEALEICKQIAEALEAAHEKGIVHRDLKPANVMMRPDGTVKVLDFGLARTAVGESSTTGAGLIPDSPTVTSPARAASPTIPGVIMGTAGYMSPEQARGKPVDKRSDIFSFGCVLYEMLTGVQPFAGETVTDSLGAILHREPEWALLPSDTPPTIQLLLRRCLAKDRNRRLHDIGDARIELENAMADPTSSFLGLAMLAKGGGASRGYRSRRGTIITSAMAVVVALGAGLTGWRLHSQPPPAVRKLDLGIRDYEPERGLAISPDGRKVVYSANQKLWVRELDKLESRELRGTEQATQPTWSPDSMRIAYAVENKLWHISAQGGSPIAVGTLPTAIQPVGGISWTEDDRFLAATGNTGLHEVSARGGEVRTIHDVDPKTEEDFHHAAALPGGRGVLFTTHKKGGGPDSIDLWTPHGRKTLYTLPGERFDNPVYSHTGHVVYSRSTKTPGLWALPFRLDTLETTGEPFLIISDATRPAVSPDGTLVFFRGTMSTLSRLVWVDRDGKTLETVGQPQPNLASPRLSPDGTRIAVDAQDPDSRNIWIHDLGRGTKMRLTFDQITPSRPLWIFGRDQIAYSTGGGGEGPAWIRNADGTGVPQELPLRSLTSCSRDGKFLLFEPEGINRSDDIGYFSLDGQGKPMPLIEGDSQDRNAEFSPDGTLVAYEHRDAGTEEVFLTTFPDGDGRWQVSVNSGTSPRWSPKGDEIFYVEVGTFSLMSVSVEREPKLTLGAPKKLFSGQISGLAPYAGYDISADAQRLLVVQVRDPNSAMRGMAIVENWFAEFEDRP